MTSRPEIPNERLSEWIDFLENWAQQRSRYAEWLAADYQRDANWLQCGPAGKGSGPRMVLSFHEEPLPWRFHWLSFERTAPRELLDRAYRIAADRAEEYEKAVINDQLGVRLQDYGLLVTSRDLCPYDPSRPAWYQASNQMFLEAGYLDCFRLLLSLKVLDGARVSSLYTAESQRRGTILYLALRMYYNDHAQLPESLDALVAGKYLHRLPVVPIVCKPFYYEPIGAREELNAAIRLQNEFLGWPAHTRGYE